MDHPTVQVISEVFEKEYGKIDGIVGFPFFARFRMAIDYQAKELTFKPSGLQAGRVSEGDYKLSDVPPLRIKANRSIEPSKGLWGFAISDTIKKDAPGRHRHDGLWRIASTRKADCVVGDRIVTFGKRWIINEADLVRATSQVNAKEENHPRSRPAMARLLRSI